MHYCNICGERYELDANGVSNHINDDGHIDHDLDADHVAFGESEQLNTSQR